MKITCETSEEFYNLIQGMVERGLTFEADASTLTLNLTGGF